MSTEPMEIELQQGISERKRIEILGRVVDSRGQKRFKDMIRESIRHGVVDITQWTTEAIEALLMVCTDYGVVVTLKRDCRYFMLASNPATSDIPIVAKAIFDGII